MKIIILNWRCPRNPLSGGAEKVTLEHAKAWVKKGQDVTWICGNYPHGKKFEILDGIKIYRFGSPTTIYILAPFIYWLKFKADFDLVIDEIHGLPFLIPIWAYKSKKLAYIHEVAQEIWDEMFFFPINFVGKLYEKIYFLFYKKTSFLTGSPSTKKDLIKYGIPEKNITIIPHGLFLKSLNNIPKKRKKLTLIFISRLVKMKGIEEALKIFSLVNRKVKKARFFVVGDGEKNYINYLKQLTRKLKIEDDVRFFGYINDQKKTILLQSSHLLIHTSVREGFGLVVTEANSQGTPAIVYDSPGLRDVVINNINGLQIPKGDVKKMAYKIIEVFKDKKKYNYLVKKSIEYSKRFDWQKITEQSFNLIRSLML